MTKTNTSIHESFATQLQRLVLCFDIKNNNVRTCILDVIETLSESASLRDVSEPNKIVPSVYKTQKKNGKQLEIVSTTE